MFKKTFCTSPWFSMRIRANGDFAFCRWAEDKGKKNIRDIGILDYFQKEMSGVRMRFLSGEVLPECHVCYNMEKHGKISGRQKQLLKTGIRYDNFKTLHTSTILDHLKYSQANNGDSEMLPVDWQIDLGNYCNSACVMCQPQWSNKLATEFYKLGITDQKPEKFVWSENEHCLEKFIEVLEMTPNVKYLHFLGGETTMMPAFKKILNRIKSTCNGAIIGFTTNMTTFDNDLIEILKEFREIHIGLSIETLTKLNDYIRWPSKIDIIKQNLDAWIRCAKENDWRLSIRPTPNLLSISRIKDLFELAYNENLTIESCHFMYRPKCLTIQSLPMEYRKPIIRELQEFVDSKSVREDLIINVRNPDFAKEAVIQDARSFIDFLKGESFDASNHSELVQFLRKIESSRGNSILTYLPEYEKFFRSIGY